MYVINILMKDLLCALHVVSALIHIQPWQDIKEVMNNPNPTLARPVVWHMQTENVSVIMKPYIKPEMYLYLLIVISVDIQQGGKITYRHISKDYILTLPPKANP